MMKKIGVMMVAICLAMTAVPTASAQLDPVDEAVGTAVTLLCDLGLGETLGLECVEPYECIVPDTTPSPYEGGHLEFTGTLPGTSTPSSSPSANMVIFSFSGAEGDNVCFNLDNVGNNIDLWACIVSVTTGGCATGSGTNPSDLRGDDELTCTNPPGSFGCPGGWDTLPADGDGDGTYYLRVGTWSNPTGSNDFVGWLNQNGSDVSLP